MLDWALSPAQPHSVYFRLRRTPFSFPAAVLAMLDTHLGSDGAPLVLFPPSAGESGLCVVVMGAVALHLALQARAKHPVLHEVRGPPPSLPLRVTRNPPFVWEDSAAWWP